MSDLNLPGDLAAFLQSAKGITYDTASEAGAVTFLSLDQLKVELFPAPPSDPHDPRAGQRGCYFVKGVSLLASSDYDPSGLLLWLPFDQRYGTWDGEHGHLSVFGPEVTWTDIAQDLGEYLDAQWGDGAPAADLLPAPGHPFSVEETYHALPDLAEWYDASWCRRGIYRSEPGQPFCGDLRIRVERDHDRVEVATQTMKRQDGAVWSPPEKALLSPHQWQQLALQIESGFWEEAAHGGDDHRGETGTMWRLEGFRAGRYHRVFRSYDQNSASDPVNELGKHLASFGTALFRTLTVEQNWRTPGVQQLAKAIHAEGAFDRLPMLADALEDAGCTSREILDHCRQPGVHGSECWVLNLILDKA